MQARERILAAAVGLLVAGWLLDGAVVGPGLAWLAKVRADAHADGVEAAEARVLVEHQQRIVADWQARHAAGLLEDEDGARYHVQQALAASAHAGGFTIESVGGGQRVPAAAGQAYDLLRLTVSGQGTLAQAQSFIAGLEAAALPLRIERCELASRDPRKDLVDAALTLSTRLASAAARAGRAVPAGAKPWRPEPRDGALDAAVLAARPFLADRRSTRASSGAAAHSEAPVRAAPPSRGWALVGIAVGSGDDAAGAKAFMHNLDDASERIVGAGDRLGDDAVVAVDAAGLRLARDGQERVIAVGYDLAGQLVAVPKRAAPPVAAHAPAAPAAPPAMAASAPVAPVAAAAAAPAPPAGAAPAGAAPAAAGAPASAAPDPDRDAILQRLRQQRNRSP